MPSYVGKTIGKGENIIVFVNFFVKTVCEFNDYFHSFEATIQYEIKFKVKVLLVQLRIGDC